jgi:hypothetical protein
MTPDTPKTNPPTPTKKPRPPVLFVRWRRRNFNVQLRIPTVVVLVMLGSLGFKSESIAVELLRDFFKAVASFNSTAVAAEPRTTNPTTRPLTPYAFTRADQ